MRERKNATFFVTGTDTGAGKTLVAAALVRRLRVLGHRAIGLKPVETGCAYGEDHDLIAADGMLLHQASHRTVPPLVVAPYRFPRPIAPAIAADKSGVELSIADLVGCVDAAAGFGDLFVVEGAGGAMSPIATDGLALDLAEDLGAAVLLVAPDRLGVQSQVLSVLEAVRRRALSIAGVILSRTIGGQNIDEQENARMIRERGGVHVFATVAPLPGNEEERIAHAETHLADHRIAETLLEVLRRP